MAPHPSHAPLAPTLSPRAHQLQIQAAQAVMIDPRLATTSARNPQGPLPAMPAAPPRLTPPRTQSVSPPRTANSETNNGLNKASLSALLLHPTPANSEPNSANPANPNSANSSPRAVTTGTTGPPPATNDMSREDFKALRSLDRKFCI
ncbi:Gluconate transport-inducing protein [Diatrype stigma]|uniref:Gluconate transport-inducing protein n=1 Tax=Diatrype stigma TaxID=117547 RepID=A0AAN9YWP0_9PEZI